MLLIKKLTNEQFYFLSIVTAPLLALSTLLLILFHSTQMNLSFALIMVLGLPLCWCVGPFLSPSVVEAADGRAAAIDALKARYPGVRANVGADGESAVYGRSMTVAAVPLKAAEAFLAEHAAVLGVTNGDLRPVQQVVLARRGTMVVAYQQWMDGSPVEDGIARALVRQDRKSVV